MGNFEAEEQPSPRPGDHSSMVIKGKRTKRPRTPSPCGGGATAAVSSSSTSGCGGGGGGDCDFSLSSDSGSTVIGNTEEEEDMAYCLILLAQGPRRRTGDEVDAETASRELFGSGMKFSKVAAAGSAATRAGFDVYECKTCNRTFPSFQALGGHRASHKKPRVVAEDTKKSSSEPNSDEDGEEGKLHKIAMAPPPLSSIPTFPSKLCKPKIHECSICGSGFSSGQALGGHMRRHRAVNGQVTTSLVDSVITDHRHDSRIIVKRGVLSLDLNLPAPENDSKFQFAAAAPTQNPLLFSAPALVDCHY